MGSGRVSHTVVTAVLAVVLAVAIRVLAALLEVPVLVPDRAGGAVPLELGPIVLVAAGAALVAATVDAVLHRLIGGRARTTVRTLGLLALVLSLVPVVLADVGLTRANEVVLFALHLVVGGLVLRRVGRGT